MYNDIIIGIITALPEEAAAIEVLLEDFLPTNFNIASAAAGSRYYTGNIKSDDGGILR